MQSTDFDYETDCKACGGTGEVDGYDACPACAGRHSHAADVGRVNRLQTATAGTVRLGTAVTPRGRVEIYEIAIRDEETGGLEGRFGDWTPTDVDSGPMADYQADVRDQLQNNPIGQNGPYDVRGNRVDASAFGGTYPKSADLSAAEVRDWLQARGDQNGETLWQNLIDEGL